MHLNTGNIFSIASLEVSRTPGGDNMETAKIYRLNRERSATRLPALTAKAESSPQKPKLLDQVRQAIRTRHYSPKTEESYVHWIKRFIFFHDKRHPAQMAEKEIAQFLSSLAEELPRERLNAKSSLKRHLVSVPSRVAQGNRLCRRCCSRKKTTETAGRSVTTGSEVHPPLSSIIPLADGDPPLWSWITTHGMFAAASQRYRLRSGPNLGTRRQGR